MCTIDAVLDERIKLDAITDNAPCFHDALLETMHVTFTETGPACIDMAFRIVFMSSALANPPDWPYTVNATARVSLRFHDVINLSVADGGPYNTINDLSLVPVDPSEHDGCIMKLVIEPIAAYGMHVALFCKRAEVTAVHGPFPMLNSREDP